MFAEGGSIFVSELNPKTNKMKNTLLMFGMAGFAAIMLSSFVLNENDDNGQQPKKSRHVRLVKIENGKKMEIDTVFATDDVFVWHGDTINPIKHKGGMMVHSFGKGDGKANVVIIKHKDGDKGEPMSFDFKTVDDLDIVTESGDSLGKKIIVRKMRKGGPGDRMIYLNERGPGHFPPVPPTPPIPHIMKFKHSGQLIDLNDPNVVSYKKKDLKDGLEKIEIVRKKVDPKDEEAFDFQFDSDNFMAPMAPDAPEISDFNIESDSLKMKIIEKKKIIDGKNGKEIEVKVESQKNK